MAGDSLGGSHHSLLGLISGLDPAEFKPLMVLETPNGRLAEHFAGYAQVADPAPPRNSFAVGRDFSLASFLSTLLGLRKRADLLRKSGATIVHSNDGRTHATWALAAKLAGRKLLWHHRADPEAKGLRYLAPWVCRPDCHRFTILVAAGEAHKGSARCTGRIQSIRHEPKGCSVSDAAKAGRGTRPV